MGFSKAYKIFPFAKFPIVTRHLCTQLSPNLNNLTSILNNQMWIFQPVLTRQGCSYYGTSPSGSASTTLSPPPTLVESPFYFPTGGTTPTGTDFLFQGASHHHPALPDASSFIYPGAHNPFPFFAAGGAGGTPTTPNGLGLGQALPGPNGSIIFLPFGLNPYQQQPQVRMSYFSL